MRVRAAAVGSVVGVGLLLAGGGCAYGEVRQVVRAQFASEFDCPEVALKKRELWYSYEGPDQFKAMGCGHVRTYTCPKAGMVSYDEPVCTFVEGDADAPALAKMTEEGAEEDTAPPLEEPGDDLEPSEDTSGGEDTGEDTGGGGDDADLDADLDADAEGSSSPTPAGGTAPAPRGGASNGTAPAPRGGASGGAGGGAKVKLKVGK